MGAGKRGRLIRGKPLLLRMIHFYQEKELPNVRRHCMEQLSNAVITPVNMQGRNVDLSYGSVVYILGLLGCALMFYFLMISI